MIEGEHVGVDLIRIRELGALGVKFKVKTSINIYHIWKNYT